MESRFVSLRLIDANWISARCDLTRFWFKDPAMIACGVQSMAHEYRINFWKTSRTSLGLETGKSGNRTFLVSYINQSHNWVIFKEKSTNKMIYFLETSEWPFAWIPGDWCQRMHGIFFLLCLFIIFFRFNLSRPMARMHSKHISVDCVFLIGSVPIFVLSFLCFVISAHFHRFTWIYFGGDFSFTGVNCICSFFVCFCQLSLHTYSPTLAGQR